MDSISKYEENKEYYENLDKRTKDYKDYTAWKEAQEAAPEGLGDSLEWFTETTGIKAAVKFLAGEDCGCDERKKKLNAIFRYNKPECLTEQEYNFLAEFYAADRNVISGDEQRMLIKTYNRVFKARKQITSCGPCLKSTYDQLRQYFELYQ